MNNTITIDDINNLLPKNFELKLFCLNAKESLKFITMNSIGAPIQPDKIKLTIHPDTTWFCCITRSVVCENCGQPHTGPYFKGIGYSANEALRQSFEKMKEAGF